MQKVGTFVSLLLLFASCALFPKNAIAQRSESSFSKGEKFYSFEILVGRSPVDVPVTVGDKLYNVRAKENFGSGPEEGELWTELVVEGSEERYDFRVGNRSISSSQVGMFDVGQTYKLGSEYTTPFNMKVKLISKNGDYGNVKVSIIPEEGMPECSESNMPLELEYRSTSYLMCEEDGRSVLLKFEHRPSYDGRMDYPGYKVFSREGEKLLEVGGFGASTPVSSLEADILPVTFKMKRTEKTRSGEYDDHGSKWMVTAK